MKVYLDTSLLVTALVGEESSHRVQAWLAKRPPRSLAISDWSVAEFASAVSLQVRSGRMAADQRADVLASWAVFREASLITVPVLAEHFHTAATYAEFAELKLRAGDALHLAIAAAHGHSLATLDKLQSEAAVNLGIPVETI